MNKIIIFVSFKQTYYYHISIIVIFALTYMLIVLILMKSFNSTSRSPVHPLYWVSTGSAYGEHRF